MNLSPILTIAITTYNRANYLHNAIQSVLMQSFSDFELLVLDNASTDSTPEVIKQFQDKRIRYVRHNENLGGLANHNYAIANCKTDFLIITHDDDMMHSDFISSEIDVMTSDPTVNLVSSNMFRMDEQGKTGDAFYPIDVDIKYGMFDFVKAYAHGINIIGCPTVMLRMSVVREKNLFFRKHVGPAADTYFWLELNQYPGNFYVLAKPRFNYRVHEGQDSLNNDFELYVRLFEVLKVFNQSLPIEVDWSGFRRSIPNIILPRLNRQFFFKKVSTEVYIKKIKFLSNLHGKGFWIGHQMRNLFLIMLVICPHRFVLLIKALLKRETDHPVPV